MSKARLLGLAGIAAVVLGFLFFMRDGSGLSVSVDPDEGPSGTTPTITVSGPANTAVTLDIGGAIITDYTDANGTLVIDRTSIYGRPGDVVTITATMGSGPDEQTATTTFTITGESASDSPPAADAGEDTGTAGEDTGTSPGLSVSVDPDEGPSGTTPTITVSGPANTAVTLDIGGAIITDYTDANGTLVIDRTSIYGRPGDVVTITATMGSGPDEQTATTTFTVTALDVAFDVMVTVGSDPSGHHRYTGMPEQLELRVRSGSIVIEGSEPFVPVSGEIAPDGSFTATGVGTVAGYQGTSVEMVGTVTPSGLHAEYSMGVGGELPGGRAITYVMSGTPIEEPGDDTEAPDPADLESDVADFYTAFNTAQGAGDDSAMLALLNPLVTDRYGTAQCASYLASTVNPGMVISVLEVTGFGDWEWERDGEATIVPEAVTLIAEVFVDGGKIAEQEVHLSYHDGQLSWFTDCGDPNGI